MDLDAVSLLGGEIDKSKVPPIHQKRILAFVNHFILTTCTFLNDFATQCESKFIVIERKLQKVEASLIILEEKLASIPDLDEPPTTNTETTIVNSETTENQNIAADQLDSDVPSANTEEQLVQPEQISTPPNGIKASEDTRYRKYFKMVQFGVPPPAVKLKMSSEGLDPEILETPDFILPDGVSFEAEES